MLVTKRLDLALLATELAAAQVPVNGLGTFPTATAGESELHTYDEAGAIVDVPPEAAPVVEAHVAPPLVIEFAGTQRVEAIVRTTSADPLEVFRFPTEQRRLYQADLTISGIDAGSGASLLMEGRFVWKRPAASAVMVGITVVSNIRDATAGTWAPNAAPHGPDVVFTVQGAAGRTVDWLLRGDVAVFAPAGLEA